MSVTESTYYGLTRVREQSPEAKDWATVDRNPEVISQLLKAFEQHAHTGTAGINYPGYDPTTPILPSISEISTGGVLTPGSTVSVRLSYLNAQGLETAASAEQVLTLSPATPRPLTPQLTSTAVLAGGLAGGTYIYAMTKVKGSGETPVSDVLPVTIPYDNTYSVTIGFQKISDYPVSEGITKLNIYRSSGLSTGFQLVTSITNTATTSWTDSNTTPTGGAVQPPVNNTFDASRKATIDWSAITHPANATHLRVYISQQAGLWSTDHLLTDIDLTTSPANYIDYLGSEVLGSGWPLNTSQVPSMPPKLNLASEATGGLNLTADSDFHGYKASNLVLGTSSQNIQGAIWYDTTASKFKGFGNGVQIDLSPAKVYKNWIKNPSAETNSSFVSATATSAALTRDTSKSSIGIASHALNNPGAAAANVTWDLRFASGTALTDARNDGASVNTGDNLYVSADFFVNVPTGVAGSPKVELWVDQWDSQALAVSTKVATVTPVLGTAWQSISGVCGIQSSPYTMSAAVVRIRFVNGASVQNNMTFYVDKVLATKVVNPTDTVAYFDGDAPGAQWQGTAHNSTSLSQGAFQHGLEEAGGHTAQNITFPGGPGSTNVAAILARIADTATGARIQVQPTVTQKGLAASPSLSSTAATALTDMSATITPQFPGQLIRIDFRSQVQLSIPSGQTSSTFTVNLEAAGNTISNSDVPQTAVVNNQQMSYTPTWYFSAPSYAPITFRILGWTSAAATATLVGINRELNVSLVF